LSKSNLITKKIFASPAKDHSVIDNIDIFSLRGYCPARQQVISLSAVVWDVPFHLAGLRIDQFAIPYLLPVGWILGGSSRQTAFLFHLSNWDG